MLRFRSVFSRSLSVLVLAYTPKRNTNAPLTQNSLAGSKKIANFMDSIFALGTSKKDKPSSRYIKQIKVRSCELTYGEDNVIEARIVKEDTFLHMVPTGYGSERDNLDEPDEQDILRDEAEQEIARRIREGESYRSISKEMGISTRQVFKVNQVLKKSAPESPCFTVSLFQTRKHCLGREKVDSQIDKNGNNSETITV